MDPLEKTLQTAIRDCLEHEVEKIIVEEAESAAKRTEDRVRGLVGSIATRVLTDSNFQRCGNDLHIVVKFPGAEKPTFEKP